MCLQTVRCLLCHQRAKLFFHKLIRTYSLIKFEINPFIKYDLYFINLFYLLIFRIRSDLEHIVQLKLV